MGILNVTPDSFSDGGSYASVQAAVDAGMRMLEEGADLVDAGGESTRPGAQPVALEEELRRVLPVVEGLARRGARVSVDTSKAEVARQALERGAKVVNDVTALSDPEMASVCTASGCTVCLMHMQGTPATMQKNPSYGDVVSEVRDFLLERVGHARSAGIAGERIWIDPGIGFGKTDEHNMALIRGLPVLVETGFPVLLGVSRKGFIGRIVGSKEHPASIPERLPGTLALQVIAQLAGVSIIRTHDVKEARAVARMVEAASCRV